MTNKYGALRSLAMAIIALSLLGGATLAQAASTHDSDAIAKRAAYMLREGNVAYARKEYVLARQWLRQAASLGEAEAMFRLGRMYETGQAGLVDEAEAWHLYTQAAERGHSQAQAEVAALQRMAKQVVPPTAQPDTAPAESKAAPADEPKVRELNGA